MGGIAIQMLALGLNGLRRDFGSVLRGEAEGAGRKTYGEAANRKENNKDTTNPQPCRFAILTGVHLRLVEIIATIMRECRHLGNSNFQLIFRVHASRFALLFRERTWSDLQNRNPSAHVTMSWIGSAVLPTPVRLSSGKIYRFDDSMVAHPTFPPRRRPFAMDWHVPAGIRAESADHHQH